MQGRIGCIRCGSPLHSDRQHRTGLPMYRERHASDCETNNHACMAGPVDEQIGVRLRTSEITTLRDALAAISSNVADGNTVDIEEQLHTLSALADAQEKVEQSSARQIDQLHQALQTRDILGQAKGMLMERYAIGATEAFNLLRKLSQDSNTRVEIVAENLIDLDHPER